MAESNAEKDLHRSLKDTCTCVLCALCVLCVLCVVSVCCVCVVCVCIMCVACVVHSGYLYSAPSRNLL